MRATILGLAAAVAIALAWAPTHVGHRPLMEARARPSVPAGLRRLGRGVERHLRRSTARQDSLLPDLLERVASGLRAGLSLGPALVAAGEDVPAPLDRSVAPLVDALRHGADLRAELARWATTLRASADVRLVAVALDLCAQSGGASARAVDRVAATVRERHELHAEARALATQARASAAVLAIAPIVFTALVATIEPGAAAVLVTTPLGLACLVLGLALEATGAWWMRRIVEAAW
jgi:Flp pilus assembly protein TadB